MPVTRRHRPVLTGVDVERFPLGALCLDVPCLTALVGASVMPPAGDDGSDVPESLRLTVTVDAALVLDCALHEAVGMEPLRDEEEDVLVLTPREEGAEVAVDLGGRGAKDLKGWELWLHVVR